MPARRRAVDAALPAVLFVAAAAASNWVIGHVGHDNGPGAPHTVPIGWGMSAPSGVLLIGFMFAIRDSLHERLGLKAVLLLIVGASCLSALLAPPALAIASGITMLIAEVSDALVYQRLRAAGRLTAATASNVVSSFIDSAVFLAVAFSVATALDGTFGLFIGKLEASLLTLAGLIGLNRLVARGRSSHP